MVSNLTKDLPFVVLQAATNRAYEAMHGKFTPFTQKRFEIVLAREVAKLVKMYGLAATLRALLEYEGALGISCTFLGEQEVPFPDSADEIDVIVEKSVLRGTNVLDYVIYEDAIEDDLADECWLALTKEVDILVPAWEVADLVAKNRDKIEDMKERLAATMRQQGHRR